MTAGPVNRALLESFFQNPGDVYDDSKTEGSFDVVADQIDDNWNYLATLVNGGTLVPYPSHMLRQAIINGNMDVWQRNTTFTNPANGSYTADRYKTVIVNTGTLPTTIIHSRQSLTPGDIANSYYHYRIAPNGAGSGFGASDEYATVQPIENGARLLAGLGKQVIVSFYARSSIASKKIGVKIVQSYGSGGSPSTSETISGSNFTLTSTWTRYSVTFTLNTLVGKTFGTNNDDTLNVYFSSMWGATTATQYGSSGTETFVGTGNIDIAQVQVVSGNSELPFMPKTFEEELLLCQRYYEKSYNYDVPPLTASSAPGIQKKVVPSNTIASFQPYGSVAYQVRKRRIPTVTIYPFTTPANTGRVTDNLGVDLAANSGAVDSSGDYAFTVFNNSGGTVTTSGNTVLFHFTSDSEL